MGLITKIIVNKVVDASTDAVIIASGGKLKKAHKKNEEKIEEALTKRENSRGVFDGELTSAEFVKIISSNAQKYDLTNINVNGTRVYIKLKKGKKEFMLDYNDYGKISGKYWTDDDAKKEDTIIRFAESVKADIKKYLKNLRG